MHVLATPLLLYYVAVIVVFCVYGLHRYRQVVVAIRCGPRLAVDPPGRFDEPPVVTIQLPMFNERRVAERVIRAACAMDWPADRLEIQVLDDSTDESADIARRCCERLAAEGHPVRHLHRDDRTGYKAGALAAGLSVARGEFVAVMDADFVPPPDLLRRTIDYFTDESVGMVQARWEHLNREASLLTRIQALCLDGHFLVEQAARAGAGHWFNFNGTAGIWRRRCIDDAGGWEHDTLTEDTDLSYRAQIAGWRFRFLPHVTCPAELPPTLPALMTQQHRWSKGLVQSAIKLLPTILRSGAPFATRLEACFHLTSPLPYAALLLLTLLALPALLVGRPPEGVDAGIALWLGVGCLLLGTFGPCTFLVASQRGRGPRAMLGAVTLLLPLMALGVGLSLVNTRAIVEALRGHRSPFVRTPKFAGAESGDPDPATIRRRGLPRGSAEIVLAGLMAASAVVAVGRPFTLVGIPFIVLFGAGYLGVGVPLLRDAWRRHAAERSTRVLGYGST